ncbi:MAG: ABC transporter permease [Tepidisphaeraceae bacterium]
MSTPWRPTIRGGLKRSLIWAVLLAIWEAAYRTFQWRPFVFPAPSHILDSLLDMLGVSTGFGEPLHSGWPRSPNPGPVFTFHSILHAPLLSANLVSAERLIAGFAISIMFGSMIGAMMWRWRTINDFLGPAFLGLQTLPSVCWVPLAVLVFGLNEIGILFVLIMGSAFGIAISMRDGLKNTPPVYRLAGMMLGARRWRLYRYVLLPAGLPALASSLRQGFTFAWRSLMGAELILAADRHGLGFLLRAGQDFSDIAQVAAIMIVMVVIGMLADRLVFAPIERRVHVRFGLVTSG